MRYDFLYSFHYDGDELPLAIKRLQYSINSIINQNVNVCVCNTSKTDIWDYLTIFNNIRYVHEPILRNFTKAKTINLGVKRIVRTPYFFLSDIDLIYPPNYIKYFNDKYINLMELGPIRVINFVNNLGKDLFSTNFEDYNQAVNKGNVDRNYRDRRRNWFGVAPGNGLIHRKSFFMIRGYDEDLPGKYGCEDVLFNDRIQFINKYIEDSDINLRLIHMFHGFNGDYKDKSYILNQKLWKSRRAILHNKFNADNKFVVKEHLKYIQANQDIIW